MVDRKTFSIGIKRVHDPTYDQGKEIQTSKGLNPNLHGTYQYNTYTVHIVDTQTI